MDVNVFWNGVRDGFIIGFCIGFVLGIVFFHIVIR
jgi:hypothetical protein